MDQERNPVSAIGGDQPQGIRDDIVRTRVEMGATLNEIQERLRPQHLLQQAKDTARDAAAAKARQVVHTAGETAQKVAEGTETAGRMTVEYLRTHPVQSALFVGGLTWWLLSRATKDDSRRLVSADSWEDDFAARTASREARSTAARGSRRDIVDTADAYADSARETAGQYVDSARGTASEYAASARQAAGEAAESVRSQATHAAEQLRDATVDASRQVRQTWGRTSRSLDGWIEENPLAAGAVAVAVGAAVGLSAPRTEVEDRAMGETRNQAVRAAGRHVSNLKEDVSAKAEKVFETFTESATQEPPA